MVLMCELQALPASAEDQALLLKQWSFLNGMTELKLAKKGVRMDIPGRRLAMLIAPPNWNVQFLNLQTKVFCECKTVDWRPQMASATVFFRPGDPSGLVPASSAETTLQGIKCRRYLLKLPAVQDSGGSHTWEQLLVKSAELYALDEPAYPKMVKIVLARNFGTHKDAGIPLVLTCTNNRNEVSKELRLNGHEWIPFKASDYVAPRDFKRVKTATEVTNTAGANEGFSEFIR